MKIFFPVATGTLSVKNNRFEHEIGLLGSTFFAKTQKKCSSNNFLNTLFCSTKLEHSSTEIERLLCCQISLKYVLF